MEYQPLTSSNINDSIILKEVMDTHGPVSKDFKATYILHFVKKILFLILIGLRSFENKKLALVITSHLDIDYSMMIASSFMSEVRIAHLWIPIVDDPTLWNTDAMENDYRKLARMLNFHTVLKNVQKSIASGFARFVKKKFFQTFQIGGGPIIVLLDHQGRMVDCITTHMIVKRFIDFTSKGRGVREFMKRDSKVPLFKNMGKEMTLSVRHLVSDIDEKISDFANEMNSKMEEWCHGIESDINNSAENILFKALMEEDPWKGKTWCNETYGDEESDEILKGLKFLLAYEIAVDGWALLCKGNKIVVYDLGDKMLAVMNEFAKWKESAIVKGFDQAFKDHHHEMFGSTCTPQHHPACALEYPSNSDKVPENIKWERGEGMSYLLPHLHSGWAVDQAILAEEERLVIIRFGHDWDETCMQMDEVLASVAETIKNFAVIYLVDITEVPDFNTMYELYDPSTAMFFFRNKHIMIDLGTGNNNKINWALKDKQEFIDIVETVYRGARKGRGLVIAPKDYSTKYRY
nr:protein SIEVE ELEMENT OCCLUSION B-like [Ipomoea trifida]